MNRSKRAENIADELVGVSLKALFSMVPGLKAAFDDLSQSEKVHVMSELLGIADAAFRFLDAS